MNMITIDELASDACNYWSRELSAEAAEESTLMPLIETQDIFLSILKTADITPYAWKDILLLNNKLSSNLFLKHLMVLSDIGGERLQRFSKDFEILFPTKKLEFKFHNQSYTYEFKKPTQGKSIWNNKKLRVEKSLLFENSKEFTDEMFDVVMLILWGGESIYTETLPDEILEKCVIGSMIGKTEQLEKFVKERYLYVSRQTGGSTANDLGYACERYIKKKLANLLSNTDYKLDGHTLNGVSQNNQSFTKFDLVVHNNKTGRSIGIEISFQVTTNSVIERKSQNARDRQELAHRYGHKVAYIIDGSGNFQRRSAINTILKYSDCTVNFSDSGILKLAKFIEKNI